MTAHDIINKYLLNNVEAQIFVYAYLAHCHSVDDIIDGDKSDSEFIIKAFTFTITLCSLPFYVQFRHVLEPVMMSAANAYADSVQFERSNVPWKLQYADVLRQTGNEVVLTVIGIVSGIDARREASLSLREISYNEHHNKLGNPI